jgi:outer membrane protein OmpA-like peptidoglycan-associated protein
MRPLVRCTLLAFIVIALAAPFAQAQETDVEGSKDYPMLTRVSGYFISDYEQQEFAEHEFPLQDKDPQKVEGRYWRITYYAKDTTKKPSALQIGRSFSNALTQKGATKLYDVMDNYNANVAFRMKAVAGTVYLHIEVGNTGAEYTVHVIEEATMNQLVEANVGELGKALNETGSVALRGILFDTGKATLKPESQTTLTTVGQLLQQDKTLRLEIQGHTDNVGGRDANMRLSRDRADAVKAYLVSSFTIEGTRLQTSGFGDTQPVAPNTSDDGRAQNRRVVLVKK